MPPMPTPWPPQLLFVTAAAGVTQQIIRVALPDTNTGDAVSAHIPAFEQMYPQYTVEATKYPVDDLRNEIGSDLEKGTTTFGVYLFPTGSISQWGEMLADLSDRVKDETLQWTDTASFFRDSGCTFAGKVIALILDGDFHMLNIRRDILQRDSVAMPETLEEVVQLAIQYNGTDLNDDGQPDYGFCHIFNEGSAYHEGMLMSSFFVSSVQTQGVQSGWMFDPDNFSPLIDTAAFSSATYQLKRLLREGSSLDEMLRIGRENAFTEVRDNFLSGRCLFFLDWVDIPVLLGTRDVPWVTKKDNATGLPWAAASGEWGARVTTTSVPGSRAVWDRAAQELRACDEQLCPFAKPGVADPSERVNRVFFAASGGWGLILNGKLPPAELDAGWTFARYVAQPEQNTVDVLDGATGFEPCRYSQLGVDMWTHAGMERSYAGSWLRTTEELFNDPNVALEPPVAGNSEYHQAMSRNWRRYLLDQIDDYTMRADIVTEWQALTTRYGGRDAQLRLYRRGLGLPPLPAATGTEVPVWVVPVCVVIGVLLVVVTVAAAWKLTEQRRAYARLYDNNRIAANTAMAIAAMKLEDCDYLEELVKPNKIQLAFIRITRVMKEYRAYLPESIIVEVQEGFDEFSDEDAGLEPSQTASLRSGPRPADNKESEKEKVPPDGARACDGGAMEAPQASPASPARSRTSDGRCPVADTRRRRSLGVSTDCGSESSSMRSARIYKGSSMNAQPVGTVEAQLGKAAETLGETGTLRRRSATVLVADLDLLAGRRDHSLDPKHIGATVESFVVPCLSSCRRGAGVVTSVASDAVSMAWNAHRPRPDHQLCATRCAGGLAAEVEGRGFQWGAGLASGHLLVGHAGTSEQRAPVSVGNALVVAERLTHLAQCIAAPVLLADSVHDVVGPVLRTRVVDAVPAALRGGGTRAAPILVYELPVEENREILFNPGGQPGASPTELPSLAATEDYADGFRALRKLQLDAAVQKLTAHMMGATGDDYQAVRLLKVATALRRKGASDGTYVRPYRTQWEEIEASAGECPEQLRGTWVEKLWAHTPVAAARVASSAGWNREQAPEAPGLDRAQTLDLMARFLADARVPDTAPDPPPPASRPPSDALGQSLRAGRSPSSPYPIMSHNTSCPQMNMSLTSTKSCATRMYRTGDRSAGARTWERADTKLGEGTFGEVWLAMGDSGELAALKTLQLPDMSGGMMAKLKEAMKEVALLQRLRHDNIVAYFGVGSGPEGRSVVIVCEFVAGGSLDKVTHQFGGDLRISAVQRYVRDIVRGLDFLHSQEPPVVHRDLKPGNVLLTIDGTCKLADFGSAGEIARQVGQGQGGIGTALYMAPEASLSLGGPPCDIWSTGILTIQLLTGSFPYEFPPPAGFNQFRFMIRLGQLANGKECDSDGRSLKPTIPADLLSANAADFCEACLRAEAVKRPDASELLAFSFLTKAQLDARRGTLASGSRGRSPASTPAVTPNVERIAGRRAPEQKMQAPRAACASAESEDDATEPRSGAKRDAGGGGSGRRHPRAPDVFAGPGSPDCVNSECSSDTPAPQAAEAAGGAADRAASRPGSKRSSAQNNSGPAIRAGPEIFALVDSEDD